MIHEVKITRRAYEAVRNNLKTCIIQHNDKEFQKGDLIRFDIEYPKSSNMPNYKSDELYEITYVMSSYGLGEGYGLKEGYVALSIHLSNKEAEDYDL